VRSGGVPAGEVPVGRGVGDGPMPWCCHRRDGGRKLFEVPLVPRWLADLPRGRFLERSLVAQTRADREATGQRRCRNALISMGCEIFLTVRLDVPLQIAIPGWWAKTHPDMACFAQPRTAEPEHRYQVFFPASNARSQAEQTGIRVLQQMAKTLRKHRASLLAWYDDPISTGPLEGVNNKLKLM
jgi:hypothetical protein